MGLGGTKKELKSWQDKYDTRIQGRIHMGLITQQSKHLRSLMLIKHYIHKHICTLHYTLSFSTPSASFPALSRMYSFPGWLLQGQKSFTRGNSARKSLGMDEKQSSPGPPAWSPLMSGSCPRLAAGRYCTRWPCASLTVCPCLLAQKACHSREGKPPLHASRTK